MADRDKTRFQAPPRASDVYRKANAGWTMAALEQAMGFQTHAEGDIEEAWLEAVRSYPMHALSDDDLGRLLARGLHIPLLLPLALERLRGAIESRQSPDLDLINGVGKAAALARRNGPQLYDESIGLLQRMLHIKWTGSREALTQALYGAIGER